jgi:cytochrome P450
LASKAAPVTDKDFAAAITGIQDALDRVIERRTRDTSQPADLLADLLTANQRAGCPLSPSEVRDQILALLFAAHETSACALFWSLYLLARHADARRRLEHELDTILAGRAPTADNLSAPYALQVLKEALRLYPPAGRQFRVTARATTLGGHRLPEGTPVTVCQYLLHRRDESFPHPGRFDPQRFSPRAQPRHPMAYVPFGAGERICQGRHYALLETHPWPISWATAGSCSQPGAPTYLSVTVRPRGHIQVEVRRRHAG